MTYPVATANAVHSPEARSNYSHGKSNVSSASTGSARRPATAAIRRHPDLPPADRGFEACPADRRKTGCTMRGHTMTGQTIQ